MKFWIVTFLGKEIHGEMQHPKLLNALLENGFSQSLSYADTIMIYVYKKKADGKAVGFGFVLYDVPPSYCLSWQL